MIDKDKTMTL